MADEQSAAGSGFGGSSDDEYSSFRASYEKKGFFGKMLGGSSMTSQNIDKFDQALGKLVGTGGTINRLQSALEKLAMRMEKMGAGGTGAAATGLWVPGGGTVNPSGGFSTMPFYRANAPVSDDPTAPVPTEQQGGGTNPHAGWKTTALAATTYGVMKAGDLYGSRAERSIGLTPAATGLQLIGNRSFGDVNRTLANRGLSYGTTGGMDTLAMASAAQNLTGYTVGARQNADVMSNLSQITMSLPGISGQEAGSIYTSLRTPQAQWAARRYGFTSFAGPNGSSPDFAATATKMVRDIMQRTRVPGETTAQMSDPEWVARAFADQYGARPRALQELTGGDPRAATAIQRIAIANLNYKEAGGKGTIFGNIDPNSPDARKEYERQGKMGGLRNDLIARMSDIASLDSKNELLFSATQETNIARMLGVQLTIRDTLEKIARKMGALGVGASLASQGISAVTGSPLFSAGLGWMAARGGLSGLGGGGGAASLLGRLGIGGGATTAAGGGLGTAGGTGAAAAGGSMLAPILGGLAAGAGGRFTNQKAREGLWNWGETNGGVAGIGAQGASGLLALAASGMGDHSAFFDYLEKTGLGDVQGIKQLIDAGQFVTNIPGKPLEWGKDLLGIGDPPTDTLMGRNSSSAGPSAVTGLQPGFARTLAMMFNDNPRLRLNSGYRSIEHQERLWQDALKKYGSPEAARKWVAPPGRSPHQRGVAADIGPSSEYSWLRANAGKYGLVNYAAEPWHWEPAGASSAGNRTNWGVQPDPAKSSQLGTFSPSTGVTGAGEVTSTAASSTSSSAAMQQAGMLLSGGRTPGRAMGSSAAELHKALNGDPTVMGARRMGGGGPRLSFMNPGAGVAAGGATGGAAAGGTLVEGAGPSGSRGAFAISVLQGIGAPTTRENISALLAWMQAEHGVGHGSGASFNPFNTTLNRPGATTFNSHGVKNFTSWEQGVEATIFAMSGGKNGPRYAQIVEALRRGNDPQGALSALAASPWGTGALAMKVFPTMDKNYDKYYNAGVGDPPTSGVDGGSRGGSSLMMSSRPVSITASFPITVMNASQAEAERLAQHAYRRLKELMEQEERRSA